MCVCARACTGTVVCAYLYRRGRCEMCRKYLFIREREEQRKGRSERTLALYREDLLHVCKRT